MWGLRRENKEQERLRVLCRFGLCARTRTRKAAVFISNTYFRRGAGVCSNHMGATPSHTLYGSSFSQANPCKRLYTHSCIQLMAGFGVHMTCIRSTCTFFFFCMMLRVCLHSMPSTIWMCECVCVYVRAHANEKTRLMSRACCARMHTHM